MKYFPELSNLGHKIVHLLNTCSSPSQLHQIQAQIILHNLHPSSTITSHFINACQSLNLLNSSLLLFNQIQKPHVFICNSLLKSFSYSNSPQTSISIYTHMLKNSVSPNNYTFPFLLKSLSDLYYLKVGKSVHTQIIKFGHLNDIYIQNSILNLYSSCRDIDTCQQMFDEMPLRDVVSWTVLIEGNRNAGRFDDALFAFEQMQFSGVEPNRVTMVNALAACASSGVLEMGVWIHEYIKRSGWELDVVLGTSLIDMYGKCGNIEMGLRVFESMREKNVITWNSLIRGLALAKNGEAALEWFFEMQKQGIRADEVTLVGVLSACSHGGLVETGRQIFSFLMNGEFGFPPNIKHYACMIDLLARAGFLVEALRYMDYMPFEPTKAMLGALLGGSKANGDLKLSELAVRKLMELEPENGSYYVLLSNLYAEMGWWEEVEKVRRMMKEKGLEKDSGSSFIELEEPNKDGSELLTPLRSYCI